MHQMRRGLPRPLLLVLKSGREGEPQEPSVAAGPRGRAEVAAGASSVGRQWAGEGGRVSRTCRGGRAGWRAGEGGDSCGTESQRMQI